MFNKKNRKDNIVYVSFATHASSAITYVHVCCATESTPFVFSYKQTRKVIMILTL